MKIIFELPHYDEQTGGVNRIIRLMKKIIELPHNKITSGGIKASLDLAKSIDAEIRLQRLIGAAPVGFKCSIGLPDLSFPACDVCITYSDNPYLKQLCELPQVGRVMIYMMSWGMCYDRERPNVHHPDVTVMCTTQKIEKALLDEGVNVHRIGFDLDTKEMYRQNWYDRGRYFAIYYHDAPAKRYDFAVEIADELIRSGEIDGVYSFGAGTEYGKHKKPNKLIRHFHNANRDQIRILFNRCRYFVMPSLSEGLNLTPIEATLCGCPAILTDGAIGEIYFDKLNCYVESEKDKIIERIREINRSYKETADKFQDDMAEIVKDYTIDRVVDNLNELL